MLGIKTATDEELEGARMFAENGLKAPSNISRKVLARLDATKAERDRYKAVVEKLKKLADKLWHYDRSCSLEAQGYCEEECIIIGVQDGIAGTIKQIIREASEQGEIDALIRNKS